MVVVEEEEEREEKWAETPPKYRFKFMQNISESYGKYR